MSEETNSVISQHSGDEVNLLSALPDNTVLPEYRIYNQLNEDFVNDLSSTRGWHLIVDEGAVASSVYRDDKFKIDIENGGRTWYAVQLCCLPLVICAGYWSVSFEARSASNRRMIFDLAHVGDDWFAYAGRPVLFLTSDWQVYHFTFYNAKPLEKMARFEFNLGGEDVSAEFRSLRIVRREY